MTERRKNMRLYNKLNQENIKDLMKNNFDTEMYHEAWNAVKALAKCGFKDMDKLFKAMYDYDSELFEKND